MQPNTSLPILIVLQAEAEREYIIPVHSQKHPAAQTAGKNELSMQEKLIKEKVS